MKLALTVGAIWLLLNVIILALRLYATRGRFSSSFAGGRHPLSEMAADANPAPGPASAAAINSARPA
jgi:hypothetical protein